MKSIFSKPWGCYEILETSGKYLIKRITVNPKGILSLQSHIHRSEHWIIVSGSAEVILDNKTILLNSNESIYIPKNAKHRVSNKATTPLVIIELWYGEVLDENDIIRYEDKYNRKLNK